MEEKAEKGEIRRADREEFFWKPKTELGREVFEGKIISIDEIFERGRKIKESQIVDKLLPDLLNDIIFIGGSPGKGGGSRPTPTKRTARMHRSGRRYNIMAVVVVGNMNGYIGVGKGEALENRIAIAKSLENAKLNVIPVKRGCGSWECACNEQHSIPFAVSGKSGSVTVELKPAPKGIGLCVGNEAKKLMKMAGITDVWSKTFGDHRTRVNYVFAIFDAFKEMNIMKISGKKQEEKPGEEKETVKPKKKKDNGEESETEEEPQEESEIKEKLPSEEKKPEEKKEEKKERKKEKPKKKKDEEEEPVEEIVEELGKEPENEVEEEIEAEIEENEEESEEEVEEKTQEDEEAEEDEAEESE